MISIASLPSGLRLGALVIAALAATGAAQARDLDQIEERIRQATSAAESKAQSGQKSYSVQSTSGDQIDAPLSALISAITGTLSCADRKPAFKQQFSKGINDSRELLTTLRGIQSKMQAKPILKVLLQSEITGMLQEALPLARAVASECERHGGGQSAAAGKYDQVSAVMKQVFSGGDLGPNSRAVKHAADVDMPARGGTPDALRSYLNSQNGTVKNWYRTNFGLR